MAGLLPPGPPPTGPTSAAPLPTSGGLLPSGGLGLLPDGPPTGGLLPADAAPPEPDFNPTPWGFVQNIAKGLGGMVVGLGTLFIGAPAHDLLQAGANILPGEQEIEKEPSQLATIARTLLPGAWVPGEDLGGQWGAFVSDTAHRYGGASNIVKGFYEDPLAYVMDALMVAGGVGAVAKVGRVGAFAKMSPLISDAAASRVLGPSLIVNESIVGPGRYATTGRYGARPFASLARGDAEVEALKVSSNPLARGVQNLVYNKLATITPEQAGALPIAGAANPGLPSVAFARAQRAIDMANAEGIRVLRPGLGQFIVRHDTANLLSARRVTTSSMTKDMVEDVNKAAYGSPTPRKVWDPITEEYRNLDAEVASEYARGTAMPIERPSTAPLLLETTWDVLDEAPSADSIGVFSFDDAEAINRRIQGHFGSGKEKVPNTTPLSASEAPHAPAGGADATGATEGLARYQVPIESLDQGDQVASTMLDELGYRPVGRFETMGDGTNPWEGIHYYGEKPDGSLVEISVGTPDMLFQQQQAGVHIANMKRTQNRLGEAMLELSRTTDEAERLKLAGEIRMLQDEITAGFEYTRGLFDDTRAQWWADRGVGTYVPEMKAAYRLRAVADKHYTQDWIRKVGGDTPYTTMMERAYQPLRATRLYESMTRVRSGLEEIFRRKPVREVSPPKGAKGTGHVLTAAERAPGAGVQTGDLIKQGMTVPLRAEDGTTVVAKILKVEKGSPEVTAELMDDAGKVLGTQKVPRSTIVGSHEKYLEANPSTPMTKRIPKSVHEHEQMLDIIRLMEKEFSGMDEGSRDSLLDVILGDRPLYNSVNAPEVAARRLTRRFRNTMWDYTVVEGGHGKLFGLPEYDWRTMHNARIDGDLPTAQYVPDLPKGNPSSYFRRGAGSLSTNNVPSSYSKRSRGLLYSTGRAELDLLKTIQRKAQITIEHNEAAAFADSLIKKYGRLITEQEHALIQEYGIDTGEVFVAPAMMKSFFSLRAKLLEGQIDNYLLLDDMAPGPGRLTEATRTAIDDWAGDVFEEAVNGAGKNQYWAVPKSVATKMEQEIATRFGHAMKVFWDTPMSVWKASVLSLSPRWLINNFFGNTIFMGIENPGALRGAVRGLDTKQRRLAAAVLGEDNIALDEMGFYSAATDYGGQTAAEFTKSSRLRGAISGDVDVAGRIATAPTRGLLTVSGQVKRMNSVIEQSARRSVLIDAIAKRNLQGWVTMFHSSHATLREIAEKGIDPQTMAAALKDVDRALGNFMRYGPIEQNIIRRFFMPFYGFYRHMTNVLLKFPIEHPMKGTVARLVGEFNASMQEGMPEYLQDQLPIHVGQIAGRDTVLRLKNMNPLSMINDDFPIIGMLNPFLKIGLERQLGISTFTGEDFPMPENGSMVQTSDGRYWNVERDSSGEVLGVSSASKPLPSIFTHLAGQFGPTTLIPQFQLYPKSVILNAAGYLGIPVTQPKTSLASSVAFDEEMQQQALAAAKPTSGFPDLFGQ